MLGYWAPNDTFPPATVAGVRLYRPPLMGIALVGSVVAGCASSPPSVAPSPSPPASPAASSLSGVGSFFAVSVADLQASAAWYVDKLGLTEAMQLPPANGATVILLKADGLTVELIHQDTGISVGDVAPSLTDRTLLRGLVKAGVIVDFDATVAWLRARNVPIAFGPFPATTQQPANPIIADNEGNLIQFIGR